MREQILEPFYTTRSARSAPGLGLTLARRLAESNGGTLIYVPGGNGGCFELDFRPPTRKTTSCRLGPMRVSTNCKHTLSELQAQAFA